jgi:hypothetical protein
VGDRAVRPLAVGKIDSGEGPVFGDGRVLHRRIGIYHSCLGSQVAISCGFCLVNVCDSF